MLAEIETCPFCDSHGVYVNPPMSGVTPTVRCGDRTCGMYWAQVRLSTWNRRAKTLSAIKVKKLRAEIVDIISALNTINVTGDNLAKILYIMERLRQLNIYLTP